MSSQDKTAVQPVGGKTADKVFRGVAYACGILILVVLAAVFLFLFFRAWPLIGGDQAANSQTVSSFTGGKASSFWGYVLPLLFGTVLVSLLALLIAFFVSIGIALFISHYAPKKLATALSYVVDLLAAIPSVIYGLWGGLILVPAIYVLELGCQPPGLHSTVRGPGRQPAAHRRHRGCGARRYDFADYHLHVPRYLHADPAPARRGRAGARRHQVGDDSSGRAALRQVRYRVRLHAGSRPRAW